MNNKQELRIAVISSSFNEDITKKLTYGAVHCLEEHNYISEVISVPGTFELPIVASKCVANGFNAIIALGCVIRGDTVHFDYVCRGCTDGLMRVMLDHNIPIGFGVLMTENTEQAHIRASSKIMLPASDHNQEMSESNKGYEAALAVVNVLEIESNLKKQMNK